MGACIHAERGRRDFEQSQHEKFDCFRKECYDTTHEYQRHIRVDNKAVTERRGIV